MKSTDITGPIPRGVIVLAHRHIYMRSDSNTLWIRHYHLARSNTPAAGARFESRRPDECAVCDSTGHGLPFLEVIRARRAHVPYVSKATGGAAGKSSGAIDGGQETGVMKSAGCAAQRRCGNRRTRILFGEVARLSVQQIPRRGHDSRSEMRSTGEVIGHFEVLRTSFCPRRQLAAGQRLPRKGTVFLSVNDRDKRHLASLGKELAALGFRLLATRGTAAALEAAGIEAEPVFK